MSSVYLRPTFLIRIKAVDPLKQMVKVSRNGFHSYTSASLPRLQVRFNCLPECRWAR